MIVFTYPGQGSQKPGMGEPWRDHPSWELVAEASDAAGRDVEALLLTADADELKQTRNAQLSTFVASMVVVDAVTRVGVDAAGHAGHSLGEYSALTASGALDFADTVRLVAERGEAMQVAAEDREGTMAAVLGLDDEQVEIACARVGGDVWVANYNAPGQVVVAGAPDAVQEAGRIAKELGGKRLMPLPVSGAFHTPFMAPARDRLRKAIDRVEIRSPQGHVVANVDACAHDDMDDWQGLLNAQLCSPVRWRQSLHTLADLGFTTFIELGPGTVLTGMAKRSIADARTLSVATPDELDRMLEALAGPPAGAVGQIEGEHLFVTERIVVSPGAGIFTPEAGIDTGAILAAGQIVGRVGHLDVRSPFAGQLMGFLAVDTERVTSSQPIAWLRTA
ncbi:MAG TPA: ACP S-malonyltransferase [Acidimicrobiales bacterium]|jgi:[acyl-carrier-protein] S-malonyltransferase|nr:ACP S-malonyltransferase [Acidimicrobiales bacterium]